MKRPLVRVALLYTSGILTAGIVSMPSVPLMAAALGFALIALLWARARPLILYPLLVLAGAAGYGLRTAILSPNDLRQLLGNEPALANIRGILRETPVVKPTQRRDGPSWRTLAIIEVKALSLKSQAWQPAFGEIAIGTPVLLTNIFAGQQVEVAGVAALPRTAVAEGLFDYRAYLKQKGIYYHLEASSQEDWKILISPPAPPLADRFRTWAMEALGRGLPCVDESLRLEWALTLGWKPALTETVSEPFVQAATYHIFAVDGLRMAIVFGIFFAIFRALGIPRWISGLILLPLIWFYVALTGWPASAIRASVMLSIVILGWVLKRPNELINSLFAAALIILAWDPRELFQAGFQLSFFVVLCLVLVLPRLHGLLERLTAPDPLLAPHLRRRCPPILRAPAVYFGDITLTSFAAWIGSIPLVAYYFNIVTPVSTQANVAAVPLCGLVLISNLASLLLTAWFPFAAQLFNHAGWLLMECIRVSSVWFTHWPFAYFYVAAPSFLASMIYYGLMVGMCTGWLFQPVLRSWKCAAVALALLAWGWVSWQQSGITRLTVLPVSGGTAIYCDAPGTRNDLLIDAGTTNSFEFLMKPYLRAQGVNRLPAMLLTHGDLHHVGGAQPLASLFHARQVLDSPARFRSAAYKKTLEGFRQQPGLLRTVNRGDQVGPWTVLHPDANDHFSRADDSAIVMRADLNGRRVLLLSDLGRAGQDALLERTPDLRADILITGLPSTGEAVCEAVLDAVKPQVIIVSDSEIPISERSSPRFCERLDQRHIPVLYTRLTGAIMLEFDSHSSEIRAMNEVRLGANSGRAFGPLPPRKLPR